MLGGWTYSSLQQGRQLPAHKNKSASVGPTPVEAVCQRTVLGSKRVILCSTSPSCGQSLQPLALLTARTPPSRRFPPASLAPPHQRGTRSPSLVFSSLHTALRDLIQALDFKSHLHTCWCPPSKSLQILVLNSRLPYLTSPLSFWVPNTSQSKFQISQQQSQV